jgi:hypothetical protein
MIGGTTPNSAGQARANEAACDQTGNEQSATKPDGACRDEAATTHSAPAPTARISTAENG